MPRKQNKITPEKAHLLEEYKVCHDSAQHAESTIWLTSTAIGLGLIAVFTYSVSRSLNSEFTASSACLLGLLSFSAAIGWWLLARRYWSVQHAMFLRMRHIEKELGLHAMQYVQYLDDLRDGSEDSLEESGLPSDFQQQIRDREKKRVAGTILDHQRAGTQILLLGLPFLLLGCWLLYALILAS